MLITLREYAEKHGKAPVSVRDMARRSRFKTAKKYGHDWLIEDDEPYPADARIKERKLKGEK